MVILKTCHEVKISLLLFAVILFGGVTRGYCQHSDLINDHFSALTKHDVKAIALGYADSAKVYSPNWDGAKTGVAGITEVYTRYFSSSPDLFYKVTNIINAGDDVVVEYISGGTLSNPEGNTPAYMKDKKYTLNYCAIFTIKNNKIIKEPDYFDQVFFYGKSAFSTSINCYNNQRYSLQIFARGPLAFVG